MVHFLEPKDPWASAGAATGQGIGSGLEMLIGAKLQGMQDRRKLELASKLKREEQKEKFEQLMGMLGGIKSPQKDVLEVDETEDITGAPQGRNISDDQILSLSLVDPNLGKLLQAQKDAVQKQEEKTEERSYKRNEKYLHRLDEAAYNRPKLDLALTQMEGALNSGDFESYRNLIADVTGLEYLKNSSAQVVNSASKEFLMGALGELTGRPNQWIEKQISRALISPQYSKEANELILEGLKGMQHLRNREIEISSDLEEKFTKKGKEIPRNFQKLVKNELNKDIDKFEEGYREKLSALTKKVTSEEDSLKKVEKGTQLTKEKAVEFLKRSGGDKEKARKLAKKLGYEF